MNTLAIACAVWIVATLAVHVIGRKIARGRLLRKVRAEAERTHQFHENMREVRARSI